MEVLRLDQVVKTYGLHRAVDGVSFSVPKGCIFGLLGPNGAGKTSLIRMITTITRADEGEIFLEGKSLPKDAPHYIGYMPEERGLYKKMGVNEHLLYLGQLKGLSKKNAQDEIDRWLEKFDITTWKKKRIEELSKGMQQKVQFIATVLHRPKIIILDEPFSGLDPINTNIIKDEIAQLKQEGASIIFSTHRMEQVEEVCEKIVLINSGKILLEGEVEDIRQELKENNYEYTFSQELPGDIELLGTILIQEDKRLLIHVEQDSDADQNLKRLIDRGIHILSYREILPSLNEIFIKTVNQSAS